jgi:putative intracellular protease/amidase
MASRILVIVTSNSRMGDTGKSTGIWAEELATPYYVFRDAGIDLTIASPAGGPVPIDPGSVRPAGQNDHDVERMLQDRELQAVLVATPKVSAFKAADFDAVFFPGGHGAMWDLPVDPAVKTVVEEAFAAGKLISSVCHGAAGLVSARRADGQAIVEGLRVNSFTDAEEIEVGMQHTVPFMLESRLRELGGRFECTDNWHPFAIQDGQLVTGQNPQSSKVVSELLVQVLAARKA